MEQHTVLESKRHYYSIVLNVCCSLSQGHTIVEINSLDSSLSPVAPPPLSISAFSLRLMHVERTIHSINFLFYHFISANDRVWRCRGRLSDMREQKGAYRRLRQRRVSAMMRRCRALFCDWCRRNAACSQ